MNLDHGDSRNRRIGVQEISSTDSPDPWSLAEAVRVHQLLPHHRGPDSIEAGFGGDVQRASVISPAAICGIFRRLDVPRCLPSGENTNTALGAVAQMLPCTSIFRPSGRPGLLVGRSVEEHVSIADAAAGATSVFHPDSLPVVRVRDVERFFIGRKRDAVRTCQVGDDDVELAIGELEHSVERQLLRRIVVLFGNPYGGSVKNSVPSDR